MANANTDANANANADANANANADANANANAILKFDPSIPFNPKSVSYKYMTFTYHAKNKNRLMIQQNFDIEEECPICLENMINTPVVYTPCKHRFHAKCMFTLLGSEHLSKYKCPLCRHDLMTAIMKLYTSNLLRVYVVVAAPVVAPVAPVAPDAPTSAVLDEIISLFDSISEEEYDDDDDEEEEEEDQTGDVWGTFL